MLYRPGDTFHVSFTTQSLSGASADADATPTAVLRHNGTNDGAVSVSIAHNTTGDYTASAAIPGTYLAGDELELIVAATVGGVAARAVFPLAKLDPSDGASPFGGPNSITLHFHDAGGSAVPGVVFTIAGMGSAVADAAGSRTISLPAGSFIVRALPAAGTLWADTVITVSGNATFTINGTAITIPAPVDASQTTAYLTTRDGQGNAAGNITLSFQLVDPQQSSDAFDQSTFAATSDDTGLLQISLLQNTQYQARVGGGPWVSFTTGSSGTFPLPEVLGTYA
jgi:hypothetical protein